MYCSLNITLDCTTLTVSMCVYTYLCVCVCVCIQVREVDTVACGSFKTADEDQIKPINYSVSSMEAALWAFYHTDNFRDGCLKVGRCNATASYTI